MVDAASGIARNLRDASCCHSLKGWPRSRWRWRHAAARITGGARWGPSASRALIPPQYVKPFVKRGKNDRNDAEAIAVAAAQPSISSVPVKSAEQQAAAMLLSVRELLVRQRTQLVSDARPCRRDRRRPRSARRVWPSCVPRSPRPMTQRCRAGKQAIALLARSERIELRRRRSTPR